MEVGKTPREVEASAEATLAEKVWTMTFSNRLLVLRQPKARTPLNQGNLQVRLHPGP